LKGPAIACWVTLMDYLTYRVTFQWIHV